MKQSIQWIKACVLLLVCNILGEFIVSSVTAQQQIVVVKSLNDVVSNCVIASPPEGGPGKLLLAPLVPSGTSKKPDIYSMRSLVTEQGIQRSLICTFDRADKFTDFNEVENEAGNKVVIQPQKQMEINGRKAELHILTISDEYFEKIQKTGMKAKFKGKSGSTTMVIPAYFFQGFSDRERNLAVAVQGVGAGGKPAGTNVMAGSPYLRSGSIGSKQPTAEAKAAENRLEPLSGRSLIGKQFIFLPVPAAEQARVYVFSGAGQQIRLKYEDHVGKLVEVIGVTKASDGDVIGLKFNDTGEVITIAASSAVEPLPYLAYRGDLDYVREKYLGKPLWLIRRTVKTYNAVEEKYDSHKLPKFEKVMVKDVVLGQRFEPVRVVFEDSKGDEYFIDLTVSGTNVWLSTPRFSEVFFEADPRTLFDWPARIFDLLAQEKIEIGMTEMQVRLSWGTPSRVNQTLTGQTRHEQWVYPDQFVYIENGVCTAIQDSTN